MLSSRRNGVDEGARWRRWQSASSCNEFPQSPSISKITSEGKDVTVEFVARLSALFLRLYPLRYIN